MWSDKPLRSIFYYGQYDNNLENRDCNTKCCNPVEAAQIVLEPLLVLQYSGRCFAQTPIGTADLTLALLQLH